MSRPPPASNRREVFVDLALNYAEDDSHGYSQKPPSGRWGPDYDCSSLLYFLANEAGYPVGAGGDKVRFTGTMLKDFEKAGFQILPFANVGISDLEIGDILLNLALHAEVYVGNGESVGATGSETGGYIGEAGDQTGHEIEKHPVTTFDKEWDYILRPPAEEKDEEGDEEVPPMNYNTAMSPMPQYNMPSNGTGPQAYGWPQSTVPMGRSYNTGYPQGNLGQMNGYSQANAGYPQAGMQGYQQGYQQGYPQGMENDLCFVMGIEGAKNLQGAPNSRKAVFDEDKPLMYIVSFGPQGSVNDILHTGCAECHRIGSGAVTLRMQQAIYDIFFKANIGSTTAATAAQLTLFLNGSPMTETTMVSTTTTVGDVNNVACETGVRTCCCGPETLTVVNNGETTVVVEQPLLKIKRVA